jgi:hypothetical protein
MSIQTTLIRENRVVLQTYTEPLNDRQMQDLRKLMESEILPAATGKLIIIADFSNIQNLPGTILGSGSGMLRTPHLNTGMIICVTPNAFIKAMAKILFKLSPKHTFTVVGSLQEAYNAVDQLLA